MRFFLDEDIDARCRRVLSPPHDCWTTAEAGRSGVDDDDDQSVYAASKGAALISHDREFAARRKANSIGQHVWLRCEQPDGPALLEKWLPEIADALESHGHVLVEVQWDQVTRHVNWD